MKKWQKDGSFYLLIGLIIMIILFFTSSQTYEQQSQVSFLQKWLPNQPFKQQWSAIEFVYGGRIVSIADQGYFSFVEFFIRKAAHFMSYLILGGSLFLGIQPRLKQPFLSLSFAWLAATGYAALDEFHQMLTGGRTPLFEDVMLDSVAALTACLICVAVTLLHRPRKIK